MSIKVRSLEILSLIFMAPEAFIKQAAQLHQQWYLENRQVVTIASTHAPEEQQILEALAPLIPIVSWYA